MNKKNLYFIIFEIVFKCTFSLLSLYNQQLQHQAAIFDSIRNQALGGGGSYGGGAGFGGAGSFAGGSTGSYGGTGPSGTYGGTYGGNNYAPNYASAGGAVGNGYQQQHASIYPANSVSRQKFLPNKVV